MPRSSANSSAKSTERLAWRTRSPLKAPWPSPVSALSPVAPPEPLDLKWLTITANAVGVRRTLGLEGRASGSRALANAAEPTRISRLRRRGSTVSGL